jgi:hypothetical protein
MEAKVVWGLEHPLYPLAPPLRIHHETVGALQVSRAFHSLGNDARVISWGRNTYLLSPINLLVMSAILLMCPSN